MDEINRVDAGLNSGWFQLMGPDSLDPENTSHLWNMPGEGLTYSDPEFSWSLTIAPTGVVIPYGSNLGDDYDDLLLVSDFNQGSLHAIPLNSNHTSFDFSGHPNLTDLVADNWDERDELTIGTGFGAITDLKIGPDGALWMVDLFGSIWRISGPTPVPGLPLPGLVLLSLLLAATVMLVARRSRSAAPAPGGRS
jgi:glucose/arabinose dehydrogenase